MELSHETALALVRSADQFPVDFDEGWQWLGYSQKGHAKTAFEKCGFVEGVDFLRELEKSSGGRRPEKIYLTVECFKMFCMTAGTEQGRQTRLYFLKCEQELKELKEKITQPTPSPIAPSDPFDTLTHRQAAEILNQIKPICFVPTKGKAFAVGVVSNHVVTDFYDISFNAVRYISTKHRKTLESLGLEVATGKTVIELKKVAQLKIPQMVCKVTTWTPLAVLKVAELHNCPISDRVKALLRGQPIPVEIEVEAVTVTPIPALPSSELRLAMLERAITLGEKLGGFDERQRLMLRDELINTISAPVPALPSAGNKAKATEITISGRANELGYRFKSGQLMKAGRIAVEMYRSQRKVEPPKRDQFVDGAVRQVNVYYSPDDLPIVDAAIQSVAKQVLGVKA